MSDITDLFEGRFGKNPITAVEAFVGKEWANLNHLVDNLPADLKPAAQTVIKDAQIALVDAAEWAGTVVSSYISANGGNLTTEIANLISGALGGASPTSAAAQDTMAAVVALLTGIVNHTVVSVVNAASPPAPPAS